MLAKYCEIVFTFSDDLIENEILFNAGAKSSRYFKQSSSTSTFPSCGHFGSGFLSGISQLACKKYQSFSPS